MLPPRMAFFGTPNSFLGIDIGTSSLKIVELVDRHRRVEVATYAQANMTNALLDTKISDDTATQKVASVLSRMIDQAGVSSDVAITALPSTFVFSTVLQLPDLAEEEMDKAVRFAARDVVPSDLDDMVLGWSKIAREPHMETDHTVNKNNAHYEPPAKTAPAPRTVANGQVPVFLTAAPNYIVERYIQVMNMLHLKIHALEVETFPLVRSLLSSNFDSALIVDMGDLATTFHIIDQGTPRVSHTIEYGGYNISAKVAETLNISQADAEQEKVAYGLHADAPANIRYAIEQAVMPQVQKAQSILHVYKEQRGRLINRSILIGGGANLRHLPVFWSRATGHNTIVGNPWKGLSYPQNLGQKLSEIGPNYAVSVGLALRGLQK